VIDIATGPGQIAAACAARGARVLGVDVAQEMVALARRRYPELEFMRIDALRLP
jgi:ubiquinone/menaquinone biosynthesis C-methylase UbiE